MSDRRATRPARDQDEHPAHDLIGAFGDLRPEARWAALLSRGRAGAAVAYAAHRLRIAGLEPVLTDEAVRELSSTLEGSQGRLLAAGLLTPPDLPTVAGIVRLVVPHPLQIQEGVRA